MLRNESAEGMQHVSRHVRVSVFVHRETGSRVLHIKHDYAFAFARFFQARLYLVREFNQLFALPGAHFDDEHSPAILKLLLRMETAAEVGGCTQPRNQMIREIPRNITKNISCSFV